MATLTNAMVTTAVGRPGALTCTFAVPAVPVERRIASARPRNVVARASASEPTASGSAEPRAHNSASPSTVTVSGTDASGTSAPDPSNTSIGR